MDPITGERIHFWNQKITPFEFIETASLYINLKTPTSPRKKSINDLTEDQQLELALKASVESVGGKEIIIIDDDPIDFSCIKPSTRPEPTTGDLTRIQFKFPDGNKIVRKFLKNDSVLDLFAFVKGLDGESKDFDLKAFKRNLGLDYSLGLEAAGLCDAQVFVEYDE